MRTKLVKKFEAPQGCAISVSGSQISLKKGAVELLRVLDSPGIKMSVDSNALVVSSDSANKKTLAIVNALLAHLENMATGLNNKYLYVLESCNLHFPITLKVDKGKLVINNFLGEKTPRHADILSGVDVVIKGQEITVSSPNLELAGQTAANIEKATKIKNRDRRVFQDGIFIKQKPAGVSQDG